METWHLLEHGPCPPFWNMACDEWLLKQAIRLDKPILRTYAWDRPSITFGYFQEFPAELALRYTVVRRPTGGALVIHDTDLTFTVILPPTHPWRTLSPNDRYQRIHERIYTIFEIRGLTPTLISEDAPHLPTPSGRESAASLCFTKSSRYDVVVNGAKVAGGAQRVTREGLLHQGSIQGERLQRVTASELCKAWETHGASFIHLRLALTEEEAITHMATTKHATEEWNRRL